MSYELMFKKAVELQQNGALNEAEMIYRQILETVPENVNVLNMLGLIAQEKGLHKEAIDLFYKAAKNAPEHFPIFFNLAISLGFLNKFTEAEEAYKKVLQLNSQVKEAYFGLGNLYWQQNKKQEAITYFKSAIDIDKNYIDAVINLAELENNTETLIKLAENNPKAAYYLGRRYFNDNDYDNAEKYLKIADKNTESAEIKFLLGQVSIALNKKETALTKFYQSYNSDRKNAAVLTYIADLEADNNNFKIAEDFYKKAIDADNNYLKAHANYADFLQNRNRILEALEEYRKAVLIDPQIPELSYNLSLILKDLREYEQALDLMFHAFYLAPYHEDWSLNLAETLIIYYDKEPEKVHKIVQNWYNKMPDNVIVNHLWSAINGKDCENNSIYNKILFDNFASTYEQTLKNINYNVINKIIENNTIFTGTILDLGCGTGLLGEKIKNSQNHIIGIDISKRMIDIAASKNIYDELIEIDIIKYLQNMQIKPDIIVAADVFCYFGDLSLILQQCYPTKIIFSIEKNDKDKDFNIQPNGRYKHSSEYVMKILEESGYKKINKEEIILRKERNKDVQGIIFTANTK